MLSFPRSALFPIAWVALVPLLIAVRRVRPGGALLLGLLTGFIFFAGLLYWICIFGYIPWLALAIMQGLFIAAFAFLANRIYARGRFSIVLIPAMWVAFEWLRTLGLFGFSWGDLAYSQAHWPVAIQIASITGSWGVSFLITLINTAIAGFLVNRDKRSRMVLTASAAVMLVNIAYGTISIHQTSKIIPHTKIAMVQGGVDLTWTTPDINEKITRAYWPMTESIKGADFVVWPESVMPGDILSSPSLQFGMASLTQKTGASILAGGFHSVEDKHAAGGVKEYNGAYLISPQGKIIGRYDKVRLVPFGEFVPGRNWLPILKDYPIMDYDRYPGRGYYTLHSNKGDIGTMICFESTFPYIGRTLAKSGAEVLFVITNDSWFLKTAAVAQHHDFSILRAVENHRYVVRNATTGISSLITPWGTVLESAGLGEKAIVRGGVAMLKGQTVYTRYGDWFVVLCMAISAVGLVASIMRPNKSAEHPR